MLRNSKFTSDTPEHFANKVAMEFVVYKSENIQYPGDPIDDPIEDYWNFVGEVKDVDGGLKSKNLSKLAFACHGNAVPERGFSINKNMLDGYTVG